MKATATRLDGVWYSVNYNNGDNVCMTQDINKAYATYKGLTLYYKDTGNDYITLTLSKEIYENGRLKDSYDYEIID